MIFTHLIRNKAHYSIWETALQIFLHQIKNRQNILVSSYYQDKGNILFKNITY